MRTTLLALALALVACGRSDRASAPAASNASPSPSSASTMRGPDLLALRFPRGVGPAKAFAYPALDSAIWTSRDNAPSIARVLGFDDEAGSVAAVDATGSVVRVDLRLGTVSRETKPKLTQIASPDGSVIYGIDAKGNVARLTPTATWTFTPPGPARDVIPEPDGSLLILAERNGGTTIWQMHPPDRVITDTAVLPQVTHASRTQVGDRVYFVVDPGLIGVQSRGLRTVRSMRFEHHVRALTTTPSGDRVYVALDSSNEVAVIDRYAGRIERRIQIPGQVIDLRMDPVGRYVLARPASGDSAWVIGVGTDHLVGSVGTEWRADLPTVAPNGWLALLDGRDVMLVDGELRHQRTIKGGGRDTWLFVAWNGFRPRAPGLDEPVTFGEDTTDTTASAADSTDTTNIFAVPSADTGAPPVDTTGPARTPAPAPTPTPRPDTAASAAAGGFTVQFGALRSQQMAMDMARQITVDGAPPRVVATVRAGVTIFRVVIGPFATRAEAERVARTSGRSYWIYEGAP